MAAESTASHERLSQHDRGSNLESASMSYRKEMQDLMNDMRKFANDAGSVEEEEAWRRRVEVLDFIINHLVVPPQSEELDL